MQQATSPPTSDEQTMAFLAHLLQLFTWFIAPLIIYLAKRESRFVAFHALQALLWQVVYTILWAICILAFLASAFLTTAARPESSQQPPGFIFFFPLLWLIIMGAWVLTLVLAIVYGIKSIRGEWAEYPIIGGWARRIVGVTSAD